MIGFEKRLVSKVLIFEDNAEASAQLKEICADLGLIPVRPLNETGIRILANTIDLGAVILSEHCHDESEGLHNGFEMAQRIHRLRRELPIFIRRNRRTDLDDQSDDIRAYVAGAFQVDQPQGLKTLIDQFVADTEYPISLIRRIEDVTISALTNIFRDVEVTAEIPYLVKDKITYGDILSLLPVDSPWFNGYMMVQSDEKPMLDLIEAGRTSIGTENVDFRDVMGLWSEVSNMAWGGLRTRLLALHPPQQSESYRISVPITVNQYKEYISFGTDRSQLCFKYRLRDLRGQLPESTLYQKFVFNIRWDPEEYKQADENTVEELVESGSLELF